MRRRARAGAAWRLRPSSRRTRWPATSSPVRSAACRSMQSGDAARPGAASRRRTAAAGQRRRRGAGSATRRREDEPVVHGREPSTRRRRLAGELHQGLEHARLLLGPQDQVAVASLRRLLEPREAVGLDGHLPGRRKVEIAAVAEDRDTARWSGPRSAGCAAAGCSGCRPRPADDAARSRSRARCWSPGRAARSRSRSRCRPSAVGHRSASVWALLMSLTTLYSR